MPNFPIISPLEISELDLVEYGKFIKTKKCLEDKLLTRGRKAQMKKITILFLMGSLFLISCSGASSIIKKSWKNEDNSLSIIDMTRNTGPLVDAGAYLHRALEEILLNTNFVVSDDSANYKLKYKVIDYVEGSRWQRLATIGALSKMGQAKLKVQAALFWRDKMVGRWDVESWLNDGLLGGPEKILFKKAAHQIVEHLKGDY